MPEQGSPDTHARRADDTAAPDPSAGFATRAIRAAHRLPVVDQRPTSVPIYQTVTFSSGDAEELGEVLTGQRPGLRVRPASTTRRSAAFGRGGRRARGRRGRRSRFASGMAAIHAALVSLLSAGDRVVATRASYGTTRAQLDGRPRPARRRRRRSSTSRTSPRSSAALAAAPTRVLYAETIANPTIVVADHAALADLAHRHGATATSSTTRSPRRTSAGRSSSGADLVVESATKYLAGHSDVLAGVVVRRGGTWSTGIRDVRSTPAPASPRMSAFLAMRGLSTLAIRMDRHAATAAALAAWLERQPGVSRVYHPALASHPQHEVASRELRAGGGMLAFELAGGRDAGRAFIDALTIPELTASLGSVFTIVVHPPSTTHRQLDDAALAAGRDHRRACSACSVGLEDLDDLVPTSSGRLAAARGTHAGRVAAGVAQPEPARAGVAGRTHPGRPRRSRSDRQSGRDPQPRPRAGS